MKKQQQRDVKGHVARNGRYKAQTRQAACLRPGPHHRTRWLLLLPAWPGCMSQGLESPGPSMGLVYMDALVQTVGRPQEPRHPHYRRCSETPWARGCFPKNSTTLNLLPRYCLQGLWKITCSWGQMTMPTSQETGAWAQASLGPEKRNGS